jgi:Na+/melibiose symporter-like transporter
VATKNTSSGKGIFLAHLAVLFVLVVVLAMAYITYTDTKWMHEEIKKEAKELRKLKEDLKKEK